MQIHAIWEAFLHQEELHLKGVNWKKHYNILEGKDPALQFLDDWCESY